MTAETPARYSLVIRAGGPGGPIIVDQESVSILLADEDGRLAEVQVARVGRGLVIIAAGQVMADQDARGFARLRVDPE
jgi:hypothetical protein